MNIDFLSVILYLDKGVIHTAMIYYFCQPWSKNNFTFKNIIKYVTSVKKIKIRQV